MRNDIETKKHEIIKEHKNYQRFLLVLLCLSVLVAAVVTIGLIKPAVTMTYTCGYDYEHTHSIEDSCYELICGMDEGDLNEDGTVHTHTDDCYDLSKPVCGLDEHIHVSDCFISNDTEKNDGESETDEQVIAAEEDFEEETEAETEAEEEPLPEELDLGLIYANDHDNRELTAEEAAELSTFSAYDLKDDIIDLDYSDSDVIAVDDDESAVKLMLRFKLSENTLGNLNQTVYFRLPDEVTLGSRMTARAYKIDGEEVCRYKLDNDSNTVIIKFSTNYIKDGFCTISGRFAFEAAVKMTDSDKSYEQVNVGSCSINVYDTTDRVQIAEGENDFGTVTFNGSGSSEAGTYPAEDISNYISNISYIETDAEVSAYEKAADMTLEFSIPAGKLQSGTNYYIYAPSDNSIRFGSGSDLSGKSDAVSYSLMNQDWQYNGGKSSIYLKFDDSIVTANKTSDVTGSIVFSAVAKRTNTTTGNQTVTVTLGSQTAEFTIYKTDLTVGNTFDSASNKIRIDLSSVLGTDSQTITLTDVLTGDYEFDLTDGQNISYNINDWTTKNAAVSLGTDESDNPKITITGLDALSSNQSYYIELPVKVKDSSAGKSFIEYTNGVQAEYTDTERTDSKNTVTKSVSGYFYLGYALTRKDGGSAGEFNSKTDTVSWEIDLSNEQSASLDGYVLQDDTFKKADSISITDGTTTEVYSSTDLTGTFGTFNSTDGTFTFNDVNASSYVFTYSYTITDETRDANFSTTATLKNSSADDADTVASVGGTVYISPIRAGIVLTHTDPADDNTCSWTADLTYRVGEMSGKTFTSAFTCGTIDNIDHYMTPAQQAALIVKAAAADGTETTLTAGTDYTIEWYTDSAGTSAASSSENVRALSIVFDSSLDTICDAKIIYTSTADKTGLASQAAGMQITFTDSIAFENGSSSDSDSSAFMLTKGRSFIIYDNTGDLGNANNTSDTTHNTSAIPKDGDNFILGWNIDGNVEDTYSTAGDIIYTVTLPTGAELIESSIRYYQVDNNLTSDLDSGIAYVINDNVVTFTVSPEARIKESNTVKFRIEFKAVVDSSTIDAEGTEYICIVSDQVDTLEQTQTVVPQMISKSGEQKDLSKNYITYTLDVNPDMIDLNASGDTFTVEDYLEYDNNSGVRAILKDITVYKYVNGSEVKLESDDYGMSYKNSSLDDGLARSITGIGYYSMMGSVIRLTLADNYHYRVVYTYHYLITDSGASRQSENTASINVNGKTFSSETISLRSFDVDYTKNDDNDNYATIEAVDAKNNNKKVEGCYFALLRYNTVNKSWYIMTNAAKASGKIIPDDSSWQAFTEIEAGTTPDMLKSTYGLSESNNSLLGPTDADGKTRLPVLTQGYFYRIIEVVPNTNYSSDPSKMYCAYLNEANASGVPVTIYYDRLTNIYDYSAYSQGNQVGSVVIENEPIGIKDVTLNKEWTDGLTSHNPVKFNTFRSYESKTKSINNDVTVTIKDNLGNTITKTFKVPYAGSFSIPIRKSQYFLGSAGSVYGNQGGITSGTGFDFTVSDYNTTRTVKRSQVSNGWELAVDPWYSETIRNRIDDNESTVYISFPTGMDDWNDVDWGSRDENGLIKNYTLVQYERTDARPPGVIYTSDASIWCDWVIKPLNITVTLDTILSPKTEIMFPESFDNEYDTFTAQDIEELSPAEPMIKLVQDSNGNYSQVELDDSERTITVGENTSWSYTWRGLPDKDCYGFKYYYYVTELPSNASSGTAEAELQNLYGGEYQIRYYNNGAINDNIINVINNKKGYIKSMPATGGTGNRIYLDIGGAIAVCSAFTIFLKQRSKARKRR